LGLPESNPENHSEAKTAYHRHGANSCLSSEEDVSNCLLMPWYSMYDEIMNFKGSLPTLILHNLRQGPNHGYQIAQEIKQKSKGVLDFKEGTLYPALHGLEAKGLITSYTSSVTGRTRFCYKLTDKGKKVLAKQVEEWDQFTGAISLILKEA